LDSRSGLSTEESVVNSEIREMEFDEMLHFVGSKKQALDPQSR
jgi:hypothetical protein